MTKPLEPVMPPRVWVEFHRPYPELQMPGEPETQAQAYTSEETVYLGKAKSHLEEYLHISEHTALLREAEEKGRREGMIEAYEEAVVEIRVRGPTLAALKINASISDIRNRRGAFSDPEERPSGGGKGEKV